MTSFSSDDYPDEEEQDQKKDKNDSDEQEARLINEKLSNDDISFVIRTMKKEAAYDEISIKQLFYGIASAFTKTPIPHNVNSKDAGAGKSYLLNLTSGYFPPKYIIALAGMSDKAILHRPGILVIEKNNGEINDKTGEIEVEPIDPIINNLQSESEELQEQIEKEKKKSSGNKDKDLIKENKERINEIQFEIKDIRNRAEKLIDLNNQIILALDTPQDSLFNVLMSLMSQDIPRDQKYQFAEKSLSGQLGTKVNRLRGMPVLFTTRVIDDTRGLRFQEKNRRLINVNPDTSNNKISTANDLIGLRFGRLPEEYDTLVVSREDKQRAKHIVKIMVAKLKQHSKYLQPKESGIKIPFENTITKSVPVNNQVWSMTVTERIMKYLSIITKVNIDNRPRIVDNETGQFYPICIFEDLKETLLLMARAASGIRPYLTQWFNVAFISAFNDLNDKPNEYKETNDKGEEVTIVKERYVGLTTEQLAEKTKEVFGGVKLGSDELLHKYLYPLINQGIIDKVQSEIDKRRNLFFPVEETSSGNIFSLFDDSDDLRLKVKDPSLYPIKNFIEESFRFMLEYRSKGGVVNKKKYSLVDIDEEEISLSELVEKYYNLAEECFIRDWYEYPPTPEEQTVAQEQASITKNILYSIIQKKSILPPRSWNDNLTEIYNNVTEKKYKSTRENPISHYQKYVKQQEEKVKGVLDEESILDIVKSKAYWMKDRGVWHCKTAKCKFTGTKFDIRDHLCRRREIIKEDKKRKKINRNKIKVK